MNSCIIDVNSIGLGLSIVAFCNRRVRAIDNFYSFLSQLIDDSLAAFCDVGEVRFGDARNLSCTSNLIAIAVNVGHGNGTIIIYSIFFGFDMDIFAFGKFLNVSVTFFSNIREVRICQPCRSKGNLTITASYRNMVTASKVDFFVYWPNVGSANSGRPEIARACQTRRGNLDVSIFSANSDVVTIDEVQRSVFRNGLGVSSIDLRFPADIL